jgi:aminopeptidase-like protein
MLGKYGLYHSLGGQKIQGNFTKQLRYILNYSDMRHDLLDIANMLEQPIWECETAIASLLEAGLLELSNDEKPKTNQ